MKNNQILCIIFLFIGCTFKGFAQNDLKFAVNKVNPFVSIQESNLGKINTLTDLNKRYPASWVKSYISVEISAYKNGVKTTASGKSDVLNQAQKELIQLADCNSDIDVSIVYLPENALKNNTAKQHDFKVTIVPDNNAIYSEGEAQLLQYIQQNCISNIAAENFTGYDLTAIKFAITEQGNITDIQVALPSKDTKIDEMLIAAISKMPNWKPATFSNGVKVKQNFVLTIGNMDNCMVNILNIRPTE